MSSITPQVLNDASVAIFPFELVQSLNQTYFLHLLLTDPTQVIPPGKSLLSMMQHVNFKLPGDLEELDHSKDIIDRVKNLAHRAFWDEVLEVLSTPSPQVQMPRLQRLYADIYDTLSPLFPPSHPILVALSSPVPPTSSPLHSTIHFLKDIADALLLRCAPVRDSSLQAIRSALSDPPFSYPPRTGTLGPLAEFVVDKIKAIIDIAELMKTDLNSFLLGTMSETQLQGVLFRAAKEQERDLVVKLWGGKDAVRQHWRSWIKETPDPQPRETTTNSWISRLIATVTSDHPVYCPLPLPQDRDQSSHMDSPNRLPPQMFFFERMLRLIQNSIQATVIIAVLRTVLPRLSKPSAATTARDSQERYNFTQRVWTLLKEEVDDQAAHNEQGSTIPLKLVNLADEVVRAYEIISRIPSEGHPEPKTSSMLRTVVERVLRSDDPVFIVLKRRLSDALERALLPEHDREVSPSNSNNASSVIEPGRRLPSKSLNVPAQMQTGRIPAGIRGFDMNATKKMRLDTANSEGCPFSEIDGSSITAPLGFEDPVLQDSVLNIFKKLTLVVEWTESVWGDLV